MAFIERKSILYVGGLEDSVTEETLHAAFIPFGDIKSIQLPKDYSINKHRGFAFIEYDGEQDAADAIDNMDGAELFGKVLRCNVAKAVPKLSAGKAVWSNEDWLKSNLNGDADIFDDEKLPDVTLVPERSIAADDEEDQ